MFHWTMDRVVGAVTAGIDSIAAIYNQGYIGGVIAVGVGPQAHDFALRYTQHVLELIEEQTFVRNVEAMLATLGISEA